MDQMIYEELTKEEEMLLSRIRNLEDGIIHISVEDGAPALLVELTADALKQDTK